MSSVGSALEPLSGKAQRAFVQSNASGNLFEGSVRAGKTVSSVLRWLKFVRQGPPGDLLMIGRTERSLKRNIINLMTSWCGSAVVKYVEGAGEVQILGRTVYVAGANDERAAERIQGMTLAGFYGDEITTWPQSMFNMARSRLSVDGAMWFGTTNPGSVNHWLNREWIQRAGGGIGRDGEWFTNSRPDAIDMRVFSFTLDDNPHLPPRFVAALKSEYVGMFYRRYILGEWCLAEGAIYESWDPARHVVEPSRIPTIERYLALGIDHGTRNPLHAVLLGVGRAPGDMPGRALYALAEHRYDSQKTRRQKTDAEYTADITAWLSGLTFKGVSGVRPEYVCVDPSAPGFRTQLHRDGVATVAASNKVTKGISTVSSLLGSGRLLVSSACPELIAEIPGYSWDDKASASGAEAPIKIADHGVDALRYAVETTKSAWYPLNVES